ncbi:hypothetical protein K1719_040316 [Acacia pycnantha]|nr:hypothetical protein K1719_040316 [Acacia pycnantha]
MNHLSLGQTTDLGLIDDVMEKLDMAFCNLVWLHTFPSSFVSTLPLAASDHSPIWLSAECVVLKKMLQRFENYWLKYKKCSAIVQDCWSQESHGSLAFLIHNKLCMTLSTLISWSKMNIGNLASKISQSEQKLQDISLEMDLTQQPSDYEISVLI